MLGFSFGYRVAYSRAIGHMGLLLFFLLSFIVILLFFTLLPSAPWSNS